MNGSFKPTNTSDRPDLQKINMKHTLNRQRSLEMACLSQLTYVAYNQGLEVVRDILKSGCSPLVRQYDTIEFIQAPRALISTGDFACCGLALSAPNEIAIAIRGTENLDDYFLNLLAESNSQGIHSGFNTFVERFWEQLQEFILREYNSRKDIFITGHSLGGAAATLITKRLQESGLKLIEPYVLETYTFGAPPVSTEEFILDTPLYRFRNAGDFIPHLPEIIAAAIKRIPGLRGAIANWKPGLLETLSNYSHLEAEYLIENDYSCRQLDKPDISKIWQWVQFSRILLPQLRVKTQGDEEKSGVKARLRKLVQTLIQASLKEHRAIKYVERLNSGNLPPWIK